jgi:RNA polymerase sigma factor (sigma-70 family)
MDTPRPDSFLDETGELLAQLRWTRRLAAQLVGDAHAEDLAQEVWLAALHRDDGSWPPTRGWIAGTLRRMSSRLWRGSGRRQDRELLVARDRELIEVSSEELVERNEEQRHVARLVLELDEPLKTTLLLRFQEDLSVARIAARMDLPADTIRWRVRRGLELLRERLERERGAEWRSCLLPLVPSVALGPATTPIAGAPPTLPLFQQGALLLGTKLLAAGLILLAIVVGLNFLPAAPDGAAVTAAPIERELPPPDLGPGELAAAAADEGHDAPRIPAATGSDRAALTTPATVSAEELCVLTGLVLGPDNAPLADVLVHFPNLPEYVSTTSAADGRFRLELADYPSGCARLDVKPETYLTQHSFWFGPDDHSYFLPPLQAGTVDLGVIHLARAGAIEGRVVTEDGEPVPEAVMSLGTIDGYAYPGHGGRDSSADDGRYLVGHVEPGKWTIEAQHYGQRTKELEVEVTVGETARVDFVLEHSATISGRVLDMQDQPVAGVKVRGGYGYMYAWGELTDELGAFTLKMARDDPAELEFRLDGYELVDAPELPVTVGTDDLVIRMTSIPSMRFRLIDAETKKPLPRFGMYVMRHSGPDGDVDKRTYSFDWPSDRERVDGSVETNARPRIDQVRVAATGYLPREVTVEHDADAPGSMTIEMQRGTSLTGRLIWKGRPLAGATIIVGPMSYYVFTEVTEAGLTTEREDLGTLLFERGSGGYSLGPVTALDADVPLYGCDGFTLDKPTRLVTDAEGRFAFEGLDAGRHYRLEAYPKDSQTTASTLVIHDIQVERSGRTDLGDLSLPPATVLEGRIELAVAGPLAGHELQIRGHQMQQAYTDSEGFFRFPQAPPGECTLAFRGSQELVDGGEMFFVRLEAGKRRQVVLPITNRASCDVTLTVMHAGKPVQDAYVRLRPRNPADAENSGGRYVGQRTNADGVTSGTLEAMGQCTVLISLEDVDVALPGTSLSLNGGELNETLEIVAGAITLERRDGQAWPADGTLTVTLSPAGGDHLTTKRELHIENGLVYRKSGELMSDAARRPRLPLVVVGSGELQVELRSSTESWKRTASYEIGDRQELVVEI